MVPYIKQGKKFLIRDLRHRQLIVNYKEKEA